MKELIHRCAIAYRGLLNDPSTAEWANVYMLFHQYEDVAYRIIDHMHEIYVRMHGNSGEKMLCIQEAFQDAYDDVLCDKLRLLKIYHSNISASSITPS